MINVQIQPDAASCFATSIAMVIDKPVYEVIESVGKDYLAILHPGRPGSLKYRGHHPQDFTEYLQNLGFAMVINYGKWPVQHLYDKGCMLCGGSGKFKGKWEEGNLLVQGNNGVLQYGNHFCAWIDNKVINPSDGSISDFYTTRLIGFHPIFKIKREADVSDRQASD